MFGGDHVKSPNTHGSGCTFSSAIAAQLASGQQLREAVILAKAYVTKAIEKSYTIGKGAGPLNQFFRFYQETPAARHPRSSSTRHASRSRTHRTLNWRLETERKLAPAFYFAVAAASTAVDDAACDDRRHRGAAEAAAIERSVARFAGRFRGAESPLVLRRENREIGGFAGRNFSLDAENARRACRE